MSLSDGMMNACKTYHYECELFLVYLFTSHLIFNIEGWRDQLFPLIYY